MFITAELLRQKGVSEDQVATFAKLFPDGMTPSVALCVRHANDFDWDRDRAANHLLKPKKRDAFEVAIAVARRAYHAAIASAFGATASDERKAVEAAIAPDRRAYVAYTEAIAPPSKAYKAFAFANAYKATATDE